MNKVVGMLKKNLSRHEKISTSWIFLNYLNIYLNLLNYIFLKTSILEKLDKNMDGEGPDGRNMWSPRGGVAEVRGWTLFLRREEEIVPQPLPASPVQGRGARA